MLARKVQQQGKCPSVDFYSKQREVIASTRLQILKYNEYSCLPTSHISIYVCVRVNIPLTLNHHTATILAFNC